MLPLQRTPLHFKALLFSFAVSLALSPAHANATLPAPAPDCAEARRVMRGGVDWLIHGQKANGLFIYEVHPQHPSDPDTQNMTRQMAPCGA